jgi:hypothetical protein
MQHPKIKIKENKIIIHVYLHANTTAQKIITK